MLTLNAATSNWDATIKTHTQDLVANLRAGSGVLALGLQLERKHSPIVIDAVWFSPRGVFAISIVRTIRGGLLELNSKGELTLEGHTLPAPRTSDPLRFAREGATFLSRALTDAGVSLPITPLLVLQRTPAPPGKHRARISIPAELSKIKGTRVHTLDEHGELHSQLAALLAAQPSQVSPSTLTAALNALPLWGAPLPTLAQLEHEGFAEKNPAPASEQLRPPAPTATLPSFIPSFPRATSAPSTPEKAPTPVLPHTLAPVAATLPRPGDSQPTTPLTQLPHDEEEHIDELDHDYDPTNPLGLTEEQDLRSIDAAMKRFRAALPRPLTGRSPWVPALGAIAALTFILVVELPMVFYDRSPRAAAAAPSDWTMMGHFLLAAVGFMVMLTCLRELHRRTRTDQPSSRIPVLAERVFPAADPTAATTVDMAARALARRPHLLAHYPAEFIHVLNHAAQQANVRHR